MAHLHKLIDFTVCAIIAHENKGLLIHHKKVGKWLAVGGHIELDEDTDQALFREIQEESGLTAADLTIMTSKPAIKQTGETNLWTPNFVNIHQIDKTHRHLCFYYWFKAKTTALKLAAAEHHDIGWFGFDEMKKLQPEVPASVLYYYQQLFKQLKKNQ